MLAHHVDRRRHGGAIRAGSPSRERVPRRYRSGGIGPASDAVSRSQGSPSDIRAETGRAAAVGCLRPRRSQRLGSRGSRRGAVPVPHGRECRGHPGLRSRRAPLLPPLPSVPGRGGIAWPPSPRGNGNGATNNGYHSCRSAGGIMLQAHHLFSGRVSGKGPHLGVRFTPTDHDPTRNRVHRRGHNRDPQVGRRV